MVKHLPSATTAYAFFAPAANLSVGVVRASDTELLVMERPDKTGKKLELALCNPNLRPKTIAKNNWQPAPTQVSIELKGTWTMEANKEQKVVSLERNSHGNTVLKTSLSEGSPIYISLMNE